MALLSLLRCDLYRPPPLEYQNLVVVMIDTLRSDHLPSYGYERDTAPYLARLAAEGIKLQGTSASSWTKASVATLFTGLYPQRHQAVSRSDSLPPGLPSLPAILQAAGIKTAAYVGNKNVGRAFGFDRGFDAFYQFKPAAKVDGSVVTDRALSLAQGLESRFFLYVHYVDPHDPYRPQEPWDDALVNHLPLLQPRAFQQPGAPKADALERRRLIAQYDGEIREVDREIRRLIGGLKDLGLTERTLVVVTSDHGEEFQEHGGWTHGRTLYEEMLQVPFILWSESPPLPRRQDLSLFHHVDFMPTLLEAVGIGTDLRDEPETIDGVSRWQALTTGAPLPEAPLFYHLDLDGRGALALREGSRKLIHTNRPPHNQSFDLAADPEEQNPVDGTGSELLLSLLRHHNRLGILAAQRQRRTLDDETRKSLAALGYLELDTPDEELAERSIPRRLDRERGLQAPGSE